MFIYPKNEPSFLLPIVPSSRNGKLLLLPLYEKCSGPGKAGKMVKSKRYLFNLQFWWGTNLKRDLWFPHRDHHSHLYMKFYKNWLRVEILSRFTIKFLNLIVSAWGRLWRGLTITLKNWSTGRRNCLSLKFCVLITVCILLAILTFHLWHSTFAIFPFDFYSLLWKLTKKRRRIIIKFFLTFEPGRQVCWPLTRVFCLQTSSVLTGYSSQSQRLLLASVKKCRKILANHRAFWAPANCHPLIDNCPRSSVRKVLSKLTERQERGKEWDGICNQLSTHIPKWCSCVSEDRKNSVIWD